MPKAAGGSKKEAADVSPEDGKVFGKFVAFLKSPVWSIPVVSFMEQHCTVFDTDTVHDNSPVYRQIHADYCGVVDGLIASFCEDIGVRLRDVRQVLGMQPKKAPQVQQAVIEPVLASVDFNLFVHMMHRKNIELQLQALQMIEFMFGIIPAVLMPREGVDPKQMKNDLDHQEQLLLIQIINQSEAEQPRKPAAGKPKPAAIAAAPAGKSSGSGKSKPAPQQQPSATGGGSKTEVVKALADGERAELEARRAEAERRTTEALGKVDVDKAPDGDAVELGTRAAAGVEQSPAAPEPRPAAVVDAKPPAAPVDEAPDEAGGGTEVERIMAMDKAARADYLRRQRDKLVAMKTAARQKAVERAAEQARAERPSTAKAARAAMRADRPKTGAAGAKVDAAAMEARRSLAAKLKAHLVD